MATLTRERAYVEAYRDAYRGMAREFVMERETVLAPPSSLELAQNYRRFALPVPPFHEVWYEAFESGHPRLLLPAPREHAKSSTVLTYIEHRQLANRNVRVGIVSKTQPVAKSFLRELSVDYEQNEPMLRAFGRMKPEHPRLWTTEEIILEGATGLTGKEVSAFAIGVGGQVTGRHCDLLVLDDIETLETLKTPEARAATREWLAKELLPVLAADGQCIVVYTRRHEDDVYGHLEADSDKPEDDGTVREKPGSWHYIGNATKAILDDGSALWPASWSLEALEAKKAELDAIDLTAWSGQYLNEIIPSGTRMFEPALWPVYDELPRHLVCVEAWDPAISESRSADYSVGGLGGLDQQTGDLYLIDVRRDRFNFNALQDEIAALGAVPATLGLPLLAVGIEATAYQVAAVQEALRRTMLPIRPLQVTGGRAGNVGTAEGIRRVMDPARATLGSDKVSRARLAEARARAGKIWRPRNATWWPEFARELTFFSKGTHDDQVDMLSYLVKLAADLAPSGGMRSGSVATVPRRF